MRRTNQLHALVLFTVVLGWLAQPRFAYAQITPRERISIDDNWRFAKGDPAESAVKVMYDRRPATGRRGAPVSTNSAPATNELLLKPWVLPTGNEFVKDADRRNSRPDGNPGEDVPYVRPDFDDSSWQQVDLPHDWAIAGPFTTSGGGGMGRLPSAGVGWYRKKLEISKADAGKRIFLDVDGAMSYAAVWLNGRFVGGWPYGYASWRLDLTPDLSAGGTNVLVFRLDNPPDSSRWYPGGGIYRNVWLVKTAPIHVGQWGTCLTTPNVSPASAVVNLKVSVDNDSDRDADVTLSTQLYQLDANGRRVGAVEGAIAPAQLHITARSHATAEGTGGINHPLLWGPPPQQQPNRYVAVTTILQGHEILDSYETPFGFRSIKFDANQGCIINGQHVPLNGVCDHHDLGALGAAVNYRALQRQLQMLREMGCNAIRTSHNPPAPELLELADQMGFLVMDEAFDIWARQKTPLDYHLIFADWHEQDLRALIRRDRNHPSVILWSIGNEAGEQFTGAVGAAVARGLTDIVHEEDPTRPTTSAMNIAQANSPFAASVDAVGLNYQGAGIRNAPGQYPTFHERMPNTFVFASESASAFSSRGEYFFPVTSGNGVPVGQEGSQDGVRHQVSVYELYYAFFGASADKTFASQEHNPFAGGEFVWTGWDYLGEPTPFDSSRSSYSGIIDLAGFKKDRFHLYQAHWRPDFPMAHILPHWTWPERVGQVTPVHVFTSGDEGELFLNGKSLGRKKKASFEYRLRWDDVVFEPGRLEVVTYKNGRKWATDVVRTAGKAARLKLEPDRDTITADGKDLSFVTLRVTDDKGLLAPRADNYVHFSVVGPGEIVATDNGDPTSLVAFPSHDRKAFNGLCLVIVRAKPDQTGKIKVSAECDGLKAATAVIQAVKTK